MCLHPLLELIHSRTSTSCHLIANNRMTSPLGRALACFPGQAEEHTALNQILDNSKESTSFGCRALTLKQLSALQYSFGDLQRLWNRDFDPFHAIVNQTYPVNVCLENTGDVPATVQDLPEPPLFKCLLLITR
uniref:Uncharacterized protein n=1 Tax=Steinernema glaseri TaxID=37863 RepID=A0A1I7Z8M4_9BILA